MMLLGVSYLYRTQYITYITPSIFGNIPLHDHTCIIVHCIHCVVMFNSQQNSR